MQAEAFVYPTVVRRAPPATLFKYFGPDGTRLFDSWHIRFSQPGAFNDPFECNPHIAGWGTADEELEKAREVWEEHLERLYDDFCKQFGKRIEFEEFRGRKLPDKEADVQAELAVIRAKAYPQMGEGVTAMVNQGIGVLCLCEQPDSLLMWAHYAARHTGFSVEFDTTSEFFNSDKPPAHVQFSEVDATTYKTEYGYLRPVQYVKNRPSVVLTKLDFDVFTQKGDQWAYESEWRMLMPLDYAAAGTEKFHDGYRLCLWPVPPSAVKRVILGARAGEALEARVRQLSACRETEHIVLERAQVDLQHFQVNLGPL